MAAETLTGSRGATTVATPYGNMGGVQYANYGKYAVAANVEDGDIFELFRLPAGAVVIDGAVRGDDMDTGTETLDMDVGWAANSSDTADADGFGNLGVWTGDAVGDIKPEAYNYFPYGGILKDGPKAFTLAGGETMVQIEANAVSATFAAGDVWSYATYINPFATA